MQRSIEEADIDRADHLRAEANNSFEPQERLVNDEAKLHATFEVGDVSHQGDLILVCIAELPKSAKPRENRQLADGTSQGSRHVLERGDVYDCDPEEVAKLLPAPVDPEYIGPVFLSPVEPTADDLMHPEHGNQGFPAGSVVAVVYQRTVVSEERIARVRD